MLPMKEYERKTKCIQLLQIYAKYKREFLNPGVNKQDVWKKIAREMKEKGSFNYDELHWCRMVEELKQNYERIKYIPATSGEMIDFKIAAKNAFQTIENTVPDNYPAPETSSILPLKKYESKIESVLLLQVYAKYKTEFLSPGVNKQKVWRKIACEMKEKGFFNCDELHCCHKVAELRQDYERIKYTPVTSGEMIDFKIAAKNAFQAIKTPVTAAPNKEKMAPWMRKVLNKDRLFGRNIALLTVYTLHKDEFNLHINVESVWRKIAVKMNKKFPKFQCRPKQCRDTVFSMKKQYEKVKDNKVVPSAKDAIFLKKAKLAFETKEHPEWTFMGDQKKQKQLASLKAFNMYKAQLLSPDANQQELWQKITEAANKLSVRDKPYSAAEFINHMQGIRYKYDKLKYSKTDIITPEDAIFFEEAKLVFESTGSEAISVDQILHRGYSEKVKQKHLALLRAYNIYKAEFSSPNEDDASVWEKIAGTVRISCSLNYCSINDCRLELSIMKEEYEKKKQYLYPLPKIDILFEEEKLAFETIGYPEEHEQMD